MINKLLLFVIALVYCAFAFSQDLVVLKNGQRYENCKITKEDSVDLYFEFQQNGQTISTHGSKDMIESYQYNLYKTDKKTKDSVTESKTKDIVSLGIGGGLDYGGFGINLLFYPQHNIGLFAGAGYALIGLGYNAGIRVRAFMKDIHPYLIGMYGYNTAIKVINATKYDKFFYGYSLGLGEDFNLSRRNTDGYLTFAIIFPLRIHEVDDYINDLKNNHNVEFNSKLFPLTISIGYRMKFQ